MKIQFDIDLANEHDLLDYLITAAEYEMAAAMTEDKSYSQEIIDELDGPLDNPSPMLSQWVSHQLVWMAGFESLMGDTAGSWEGK